MKRCSACKETKDKSEFYKTSYMCKPCRKIYYRKYTDYFRERATGCTKEEYEALQEVQSGKCAICGIHSSLLKNRLSADHCHETGKIRGLLCVQCNLGIGNFKDSIENLFNAIVYLKSRG